jgi:cell division transport system permease protein
MSEKIEKYNRKGVRTSYVSTVIGISLVLFMMGLVIGGILGLDNVQKQAKESLQVDLFFKAELNDADIKQIAQELKKWDKFTEVYFVSPESAAKEFSGDDQNEKQVLAIFEGDNPLPSTIGFKPKAEFATKEGMKQIKKELLEAYPEQIDEVSYEEASVNSVNLGFKQFVFLFGIVALLLVIVAVAMINNTIRLALYAKRFTIKTMQLVGATHAYIRRPFLIQSIFQGFVSAIIGMGLLMTLFFALNNVLDSIEISYDLASLIILFGSLLGIGIVITFVSTWIALNKFLRMKLDELY